MTDKTSKTPWYAAGLHFECSGCGNCCAGPQEGYIWITPQEIEILSKHLNQNLAQTCAKYIKRCHIKLSIIEDPPTKDCIFLCKRGKKRTCKIYPARPNQCRTWPFWWQNLISPDHWNLTAQHCPGINRGRLYTFEQIETLKNQVRWWPDE